MNAEIYNTALWIVVAWPLLLAIPALHARLPWPHHLAIVPAAVLVLWPGDAALALPWLLFGTGLAVDGDNRWILMMSVVIWLTAATVAASSRRDPASARVTPFFLLTLAGNLGAVLATELVGFFSFATLMGYGFYALLIEGGDAARRRAGRFYLIFLIVADLLLFEALLLAASAGEDLRYAAVRQAMAGTASAQFYLGMVLLGFALKAGIWPAHLWLVAVFGSASRPVALLLGGVPVAMGLLGAVRWLPLGEQVFDLAGMLLQLLGVTAMLYAARRLYTHGAAISLPAWGSVAAGGLLMVALGTGLAYPALWRQYEYLIYPGIAALGLFLATLSLAIGRSPGTRPDSGIDLPRRGAPGVWAGRRLNMLWRWVRDELAGCQSRGRAASRQVLRQYWRILDWQKPRGFEAGWRTGISLFVLLGLALAWLGG